MSKVELLKNIEKLETHIFMIDMVDHWTSEDIEARKSLTQELKELQSQLVLC